MFYEGVNKDNKILHGGYNKDTKKAPENSEAK